MLQNLRVKLQRVGNLLLYCCSSGDTVTHARTHTHTHTHTHTGDTQISLKKSLKTAGAVFLISPMICLPAKLQRLRTEGIDDDATCTSTQIIVSREQQVGRSCRQSHLSD